MTYNGVVVLQLDLMLEMEFIIIQFLNLSLLTVSSILTAPPMLVYQECTSTELTGSHVRIALKLQLLNSVYLVIPQVNASYSSCYTYKY